MSERDIHHTFYESNGVLRCMDCNKTKTEIGTEYICYTVKRTIARTGQRAFESVANKPGGAV